MVTRAAAGSGDVQFSQHPTAPPAATHAIGTDARLLLPPPGPSSAQLIAVVSANTKVAPPPPAPEVSPFMLFCRANWGYFAALQTVALIGRVEGCTHSRGRVTSDWFTWTVLAVGCHQLVL
jgi:hypothetical protein